MVDLTTKYLGLELSSPLVGSPSPLMEHIDNIKKMEDAGAAAVVLYSLYAEQIEAERYALDHYLESTSHFHPEAADYFPEPKQFHARTDDYLKQIERAKDAVDIPVIASLNGSTPGTWVELAQDMESAGASAIELNIYRIPSSLDVEGSTIEQETVSIVSSVCEQVKIPVAVKLSPYYSNFANLAKRLAEVGAAGLVLFNRFYQPDIDLETLEAEANLILSTPFALRLPLRWIGLLYGRVNVDYAATSGIHSAEDALKLLLVGANVTMMTSAILESGIDHFARVKADLQALLEQFEYDSVQQLQGSASQINNTDPSVFERTQYMRVLRNYQPNL